MTNLSDVFAAGLEQVRKSWGWFLTFGILLIALGILCVGKAQTATFSQFWHSAGCWSSVVWRG